jgi:hypothetical protein
VFQVFNVEPPSVPHDSAWSESTSARRPFICACVFTPHSLTARPRLSVFSDIGVPSEIQSPLELRQKGFAAEN